MKSEDHGRNGHQEPKAALSPEASLPLGMVIRLRLTYEVASRRARPEQEHWETVGLMFDVGSSLWEIEEAVEAALSSAGTRKMSENGGCWGKIQCGGKDRAVARGQFEPRAPSTKFVFPSEKAVREALVDMAREAGARVAAASGAVAWRRAGDVDGATTSMEALGLLFEEFDALADSLDIGRAVGKPAAAGAKKSASL